MDENKQMEQIFAEGGITDDGMNRDPVSGNEVPPGSLAEEVRDDVPARLSTGEYVVPADVVRYFGVSYFEKLRKKAKEGLGEMEADGRIGGEPMEDEDDFPFSEEELEFEEEEETIGMAEGGLTTPPAFNPAQYTYGADFLGGTPGAAGSGGVSTQTYVNAAGDRMSILFVNGQPVTAIPSGFVPDTAEGRQKLAGDTSGEKLEEKSAEKEGTTDQERAERRGEAAEAGINPEDNLFNMSEEQLRNWTQGGVPKKLGAVAQGAGAPMGGPIGLIAGVGANMYGQLEPLQRARTAAMVAEERGLTDLAAELEAQAKRLEEELKPGARMLSGAVASGVNEYNRHFKAFQNYEPSQAQLGRDTSPASTGGTLSAGTTGGSGRAAEQDSQGRLSFGQSVREASGRAAAGLSAPSGARTDRQGASMGERVDTPRADRTTSAAGARGDFGRGAGMDLSMGTERDDSARGRAERAAERTGTGMATRGRATGGLVGKPTTSNKKSRRKIKTVEK